MRMSCNGCRVLRKACPDDCVIRPCLGWIHAPEAQGNATLFLAKFYGRAGLNNLLSTRPEQQRAATFRSLLYEACGRIVNPVYGSVGLLWSGKWQLCQAAVESVLKGAPITQLVSTTKPKSMNMVAPIKASDIRHLANRKNHGEIDLHKVNTRSRAQFKQSGFWSIRAETGEPGPLEGENPLHNHLSMEIANKGSSMDQENQVVIKREQDAVTRNQLRLDLSLGPKCTTDDEEAFSSGESDDRNTCRVDLCLTVRG